MTMRTRNSAVAALMIGALVSGCGSSDGGAGDTVPAPSTQSIDDELPNACPVDGCTVKITSAAAATGGEVALVFEANYTPDFERNHIHVFWDSQEAGAVSSDFQDRGFETQGKWHPTDDYPEYVTQADVSVASEFRGDSTTLCVTAADTDHAVLDPAITECRDVAEFLK